MEKYLECSEQNFKTLLEKILGNTINDLIYA